MVQNSALTKIVLLFLSFALAVSASSPYVLELDSIPSKIGCTEKILVMREKFPEQLLVYPTPARNWSRIKADTSTGIPLYAKFEDNFDFLMFMPQTINNPNQASSVRVLTKGLGQIPFESKKYVGLSTRLKHTFETAFYIELLAENPNFRYSLFVDTHIGLHETGHYWCCFLKGFYENEQRQLNTHYHTGMQLFGTDSLFADPMGYGSWIIEPNYIFPVNYGLPRVKQKFSELSQYLMGLIPSEEVKPFKVHYWDTASTELDSKTGSMIDPWLGPSVWQNPVFLGGRTITIDDVIKLNGRREPAYPNTQRDFNLLPIIVVPYGDTLETKYMLFLDSVMKALPPAWAFATDNRSTLRMGCDLFISTQPRVAAAQKFGIRYLQGERVLVVDLGEAGRQEVVVELSDLRGRRMKKLFQGSPMSSRLVLTLAGQGGRLEKGGYVVSVRQGSSLSMGKIVVMD